jgi:hypothetical protein
MSLKPHFAKIVALLLTFVTVLVTRALNLAQSDAAWEAFPDRAGECGARARTCNPLPGGIGHQPLGTLYLVIAGQKARSAVFNLKPPAIHAAVKPAKRFPPSVCLLRLSMDHRHRRPKDAVLRTAMSGGNDF